MAKGAAMLAPNMATMLAFLHHRRRRRARTLLAALRARRRRDSFNVDDRGRLHVDQRHGVLMAGQRAGAADPDAR